MQSGYSILTRRIKGIDVNVWLTLLAIIFISGVILIVRVTTAVQCQHFDITTTDISGSQKNSLYVDESVIFTAKTSKNAEWEFDDGTSATGTKVEHKFKNDGNHVAHVVLNGNCPQLINLKINKKIVAEQDLPEANPITGPSTAVAGSKVTFSFAGIKKASSFEWSVLNLPYPVGYRNQVIYQVNEGKLTIQLKLDNNPARTFTRDIIVTPKPHRDYVTPHFTGQPNSKQQVNQTVVKKDSSKQNFVAKQPPHLQPVVQIPSKSDQEYKAFLDEVAEHHTNGQNMANYLCDRMDTFVTSIYDSKKTFIDLRQICAILTNGNYKIINFHVVRDNTNCVKRLEITYADKPGFFKKLFHGSKSIDQKN